jgi:hypothetical protein
VTRRIFVTALTIPSVAAAYFAESGNAASIRGKLIVGPDSRPALQTTDGRIIFLTGDEPSTGVIKDKRVIGRDFEAAGRQTSPTEFAIGPIHLQSMFVYENGQRLFVTYWCEVCAIRTYTPGKCWCCQEETALDLRERYN